MADDTNINPDKLSEETRTLIDAAESARSKYQVAFDLFQEENQVALMQLDNEVLHATLLVDPTAPTGAHDLTVFDAQQSSSASGIFHVLPAPGEEARYISKG